MELEYWKETQHHTGYGIKTKRSRVSREEFIEHYCKESTKTHKVVGAISALIESVELPPKEPSWLGKLFGAKALKRFNRTHFLALDCDSQEDMIAAAACLKRDNINWIPIESSDNHFWLITDFIGSSKEIVDKIQTIVGVDRQYVELTTSNGICFMRATPTVGKVPKINRDNIGELRDSRIIEWLNEYQKLLDEQFATLQNTILVKALEDGDGSIYSLAANPDFEV